MDNSCFETKNKTVQLSIDCCMNSAKTSCICLKFSVPSHQSSVRCMHYNVMYCTSRLFLGSEMVPMHLKPRQPLRRRWLHCIHIVMSFYFSDNSQALPARLFQKLQVFRYPSCVYIIIYAINLSDQLQAQAIDLMKSTDERWQQTCLACDDTQQVARVGDVNSFRGEGVAIVLCTVAVESVKLCDDLLGRRKPNHGIKIERTVEVKETCGMWGRRRKDGERERERQMEKDRFPDRKAFRLLSMLKDVLQIKSECMFRLM